MSTSVASEAVTLHTGLDWADVAVDLRMTPGYPVPREQPRLHDMVRRFKAMGTSVWVGVEGTHCYVRWVDPDGFRGAVFFDEASDFRKTRQPGKSPFLSTVFPALRWAIPDTHVKTSDEAQQKVFGAHVRSLSALLRSPETLTAPVPGADPDEDHAAYRLAWAAMGMQVEDVPAMFQDMTITSSAPEWGEKPGKTLPYGLAYRLPQRFYWQGLATAIPWLIAEWDLRDAPDWQQSIDTYATGRSGLLSSPHRIRSMTPYRDAGLNPVQAAACSRASCADNPSALHRLSATQVVRHLDARVPLTSIAWAVSTYDQNNWNQKTSMETHVSRWLHAVPVDRVPAYVAAGFSMVEARRLERSGEAPTEEALAMMAALSDRPEIEAFPSNGMGFSAATGWDTRRL